MELSHTDRVVVLVDMDCFYCQVEENLNPYLRGKPIAVVQYNAWSGGGIIAVNYPARDKGVTRHMRGKEAKVKCPDIKLVSVPTSRGKADLTKYRDAGKRVAEVLQNFTELLERASVDEAYLDITEAVKKRMENSRFISVDQLQNTHVVGCDTVDFVQNLDCNEYVSESNIMLGFGGVIAEEIRAAVFEKTGYRCSAGIAHNKVLAKLVCGLHKPNQQTILPQDAIEELYENLPVRKIKSLGGKFGTILCEDLAINTMGELIKFSEKDLIKRYDEKTGSWLYKLARGIDLEPVTTRLVSKSIGCCKKFPGPTALVDHENVTHWINELALEISERLEKDMEENNRKARQMVISFVQDVNRRDVSSSRSAVLHSYDPTRIANDAFAVIKKHCLRSDNTFHIKFLGINVGKFDDCKNVQDISTFFKVENKNNAQVPEVKAAQSRSCPSKGGKSILSFIQNMESPKEIASPTSNKETAALYSEEDIQADIETNKESDIFTVIGEPNDTSESSDNDASYSDETVVISYDEDKLVFDENYCDSSDSLLEESRVKAKDATIIEDSETDSISDEMFRKPIINHQTNSVSSMSSSTSYFTTYFQNLQNEIPKIPVERNFDTSKHIIDSVNSESETSDSLGNEILDTNESPMLEVSMNKPAKCDRNEDSVSKTSIYDLPSTSRAGYNADNMKETCKECTKLIAKSDMVSHMDYHYALSLVREEAHIYKKDKAVPNDNKKKSNESKSVKRKSADDRCIKLTSFLQSNKDVVEGDEAAEVCTDCNKKVAVKDFGMHMDFHAAKRLHVEINPVKTCSVQSMKINKNKRKEKNTKVKRVASFFKPV